MATRRNAREWALQLLVQCDLNPPVDLDATIADFWEQQRDVDLERKEDGARTDDSPFLRTGERARQSLAEMQEFAVVRVRGVLAKRDALDRALEPFLVNWQIYRLGTVERNVLRLGAWEVLESDVPVPIVVNEAVDLAKFFSSTASGRFVNGVIDAFAKAQKRGS